ncbi:Pre-mRNA cleavage complex II protein Clp1-domain-containing protein [Lipomyces arxii]|uniref:Pre-mRNA cleavage complex II protein Clp1-domain-containing protein n=1 Tax=Lipomyces arxii TaxID=56418 RepID=UPI0034CD8082
MDLPGLNITGSTSNEINTIDLEPEREWRFEVGLDSTVTVEILQGTAEIFGTEIVIGRVYSFTAAKLSIYTWHGCKFEWKGEVLAEYISEESAMWRYANLHFALEKMRMIAAEKDPFFSSTKLPGPDGEGPRVLIVGQPNSGKTTLAKILTSYAVKMGRTPVVVSLDPKEPMLSVPGTISAASYSGMIDVEEEETWGSSKTTEQTHIPTKSPIVYFFGSDSPADNVRFYKALLNRLSIALSSRLAIDHKSRIAGTIIDAAGLTDQKVGYDVINSIVSDFNVDVIVTVGNERLYNDLRKRYSSRPNMSLVMVPMSGGVVRNEESYNRALQQRLIKQYFYGTPKTALSAYSVTIDMSAIVVYRRLEQSHLVGSSALPIGADETMAQEALITKMEVGPVLQNSVLALLYASPTDAVDDIAVASVTGFAHIIDVDETKKNLKILLPIKSKLLTHVYLMGSYHYIE